MRAFLALLLALFAGAVAWAAASVTYPEVRQGQTISFPKDHGSHDNYRTEWWYFTGWLETESGDPLGFQITFFRSRPDIPQDNPSRFTPNQIVFAHAAISDPKTGKLIHDQRMGRKGFGIIDAASGDTDVQLLGWSLERDTAGAFVSRVESKDFVLDLSFNPSQPVMLNGDRGYSRKGPQPSQASYYYSMPHLDVSGSVTRKGRQETVRGSGWLDREWSSDVLPENAVGWDWTGLNFDDGSALMAFQVRGRDGKPVYAGGSYRDADGEQTVLGSDDVRFVPRRYWTSPETGASYPVEAEYVIMVRGEEKRFVLTPMFDAQELTGALTPTYWEGAVTTKGGRGYLEMTGYAEDISL
ncbi:lipocalin-like domain-containing protein [Alterisphingorhabdus coralli]|uniref:Lipocalin-like domain-containing protein n=1 Tax=Alterisphingorhabdus coralli TaxID=3071408 RepID=A0AA97F7B3_9SPHN|nr:lipocalin-like domain-containing protein [Parasphingorhabdus sp. SCSIO 66989]WOE75699.1 lipocalin-like domain-containing protein [Parasphingorhabdus sp. SCSIO 66989]